MFNHTLLVMSQINKQFCPKDVLASYRVSFTDAITESNNVKKVGDVNIINTVHNESTESNTVNKIGDVNIINTVNNESTEDTAIVVEDVDSVSAVINGLIDNHLINT